LSSIEPRQIALTCTLLFSCGAAADELVDRADANGDGFVSLYELRAAYYADIEFNRRIEQSFAAYDTDGDGLISEAERRAAQALAATEPEPEAIPPTRASGEAAFAAAAAATAAADTKAPAAGTSAGTTAQAASTPPPETTEAAAPRTLPATVAEVASLSATATATTVSAANAGTGSLATNPGGGSPSTAPAAAPSPSTRRLSRSESWILKIDADNSGGASYNELLTSSDGDQFFSSSTFISADNDGDGELDPDELEVLIQSMERQRRYQQRGR